MMVAWQLEKTPTWSQATIIIYYDEARECSLEDARNEYFGENVVLLQQQHQQQKQLLFHVKTF